MPRDYMKDLDITQVIKWIEDDSLTMDDITKRCNVKTRNSIYKFLKRNGYQVINIRKVIPIKR